MYQELELFATSDARGDATVVMGESAVSQLSDADWKKLALLLPVLLLGHMPNICVGTALFVLLLALCHTVVVEQIGAEKKLSASSPDEAALVSAADLEDGAASLDIRLQGTLVVS